MKKTMAMLLVMILCLSLCACGTEGDAQEARIFALEKELESMKSELEALRNTQATEAKQWPAEYVGEWKMKYYDNSLYVLQLNADGTGSFRGAFSSDVIWEYNEKYHTIEFALTYLNSTGSFKIREKEGKTVLDDTVVFFGSDFYRASDVVE